MLVTRDTESSLMRCRYLIGCGLPNIVRIHRRDQSFVRTKLFILIFSMLDGRHIRPLRFTVREKLATDRAVWCFPLAKRSCLSICHRKHKLSVSRPRVVVALIALRYCASTWGKASLRWEWVHDGFHVFGSIYSLLFLIWEESNFFPSGCQKKKRD